jgi:Cd2+/Zn2+-exporting ATPase
MAWRIISIPTVYPQQPQSRQQCARCLRERLLATEGVRHVEVRDGSDDGNLATLELDYDPRMIPLAQLDSEIRRAGVCCQTTRGAVVLGIDGMVSSRSETLIESALSKLPGVFASASFPSHSLRIEFDRTQCALPEIVRRLDDMGFRVREGGAKPQAVPQDRKSIERLHELILTHHKLAMAIVGGLLLLGAVLTRAFHGPPALRYALVACGFIIAGWYTAIDTFHVLRELKFDIDVLMFAAAFGAAALGHFEEGALLLVLFALGGAGEELAMDRARKAIEALARLAPETATLREPDGRERSIRVEDLKIGDRVVVRRFYRLPA